MSTVDESFGWLAVMKLWISDKNYKRQIFTDTIWKDTKSIKIPYSSSFLFEQECFLRYKTKDTLLDRIKHKYMC